MNVEDNLPKRPGAVIKIAAIIVCAFGVYIILRGAVFVQIRCFRDRVPLGEHLFFSAITTMCILLCLYLLLTSVRAWRNTSGKVARTTFIIAEAIVVLCVLGIFMEIFDEGFIAYIASVLGTKYPQMLLLYVFGMIVCLGGIILVLLQNRLLRWAGFPEPFNPARAKSSAKWWHGWLALCLWILAFYTLFERRPWAVAVVLFGTAIFALVFYKIGIRIINKKIDSAALRNRMV